MKQPKCKPCRSDVDQTKNTCNEEFTGPCIKIKGAKIGGDNKGCTFTLNAPVFEGKNDGIGVDCAVGKIGGGNSNCMFYIKESVYSEDNKNTRIKNISWQIFGGNKSCDINVSGTKYKKDEKCKICHVSTGIGGKNSDSNIIIDDTVFSGPREGSKYTVFSPSVGGENGKCISTIGSVQCNGKSTDCGIFITGGEIGGNNTDTSHEVDKEWATNCKPPRNAWAGYMEKDPK